MRTTVDISPDLLERVREQAGRDGVSFREHLNRVIHRGLAQPRVRSGIGYVVPTFTLGAPKPGVDSDRALSVADRLSDLDSAREIAERR